MYPLCGHCALFTDGKDLWNRRTTETTGDNAAAFLAKFQISLPRANRVGNGKTALSNLQIKRDMTFTYRLN